MEGWAPERSGAVGGRQAGTGEAVTPAVGEHRTPAEPLLWLGLPVESPVFLETVWVHLRASLRWLRKVSLWAVLTVERTGEPFPAPKAPVPYAGCPGGSLKVP